MEIYSYLLWLHIAAGFLSLFVGLVPMLTKKGSRKHIISGRIYFYAMFGVFLTSTLMFLIKPERLLFLFLIGVFSFYNTLSGVRFLFYKKSSDQVRRLDWIISAVVLSTGLLMIALGLYNFIQGSIGRGVLYMVFGSICSVLAGSDLSFLGKQAKGAEPGKNWLTKHVVRMGGSYIATFTAFVIVNNSVLPSLIAWLGPSVVGSLIIYRALKRLSYKGRTPI